MRQSLAVLNALLSIYFLTVPFSVNSFQSNDELISRARQKLYNLNRQGFSGFTASVEPNWEVILGPSAAPESLRIFRAVRFELTVDASGAITLNHEVADAEKNRVQPFLKQIDDNVRRLLASFFNIWSIFTVSYFAESSNVFITVGNDLIVTEWKLVGPKAKQTIKPLFQKTDEGLLLTGYQSLFEPVGEGIKTSMQVSIEYADVGGMKLPHQVRFKGLRGNEPVEAELRFEHVIQSSRSKRLIV